MLSPEFFNQKAVVKDALQNNNVIGLTFYRDGSGVYFLVKDNVTGQNRGISLKMDDAVECLKGNIFQTTQMGSECEIC